MPAFKCRDWKIPIPEVREIRIFPITSGKRSLPPETNFETNWNRCGRNLIKPELTTCYSTPGIIFRGHAYYCLRRFFHSFRDKSIDQREREREKKNPHSFSHKYNNHAKCTPVEGTSDRTGPENDRLAPVVHRLLFVDGTVIPSTIVCNAGSNIGFATNRTRRTVRCTLSGNLWSSETTSSSWTDSGRSPNPIRYLPNRTRRTTQSDFPRILKKS